MAKLGVFIGCLPGDTREPELLDVLKSFAKVTSIKLARGRNQTAADFCRGYGFAICQSQIDVQILLQARDIMYRGRAIVIKAYKSGSILKAEKRSFRNRKLFIGNIPPSLSEEDIRPYLEQLGHLEGFYFVEQSKSMKFKYGYAVYEKISQARSAMQKISQFKILGSGIRVEFSGNTKTEVSSNMKPSPSVGALTGVYSHHQSDRRSKDDLKPVIPAVNITSVSFRDSSNKQDQDLQTRLKSIQTSTNTPRSAMINDWRSGRNRAASVSKRIQFPSIGSCLLPSELAIDGYENSGNYFLKPTKSRWYIEPNHKYNHMQDNIRLNLVRVIRDSQSLL